MYVRMHNELATKLGSQINTIVCLQFSSAKQTRIELAMWKTGYQLFRLHLPTFNLCPPQSPLHNIYFNSLFFLFKYMMWPL